MTTIYDAESELPPHILALLEANRRHQHEWINNSEGDSLLAQDERMTIYGPFGGQIGRGPQLREVQRNVRALFRGGSGKTEFIRAIESGDAVTMVFWETSMVRFEGHEQPHPWNLRVTEVHLREGNDWHRIHRHADPLHNRRALPETLALLE
jgi:hypothetical protein